jgi:hypothetical protein
MVLSEAEGLLRIAITDLETAVASSDPADSPPAQRRSLPRPPHPARVRPGRLAQPLPRGAAWRGPARSQDDGAGENSWRALRYEASFQDLRKRAEKTSGVP